ncbi:MAG: sulfatase-like hydrolase/transferase, partial [Bacilli bacterium]
MRILYLDIDTTRPDHLGCYGYQRNTSPNIDQIANDGIVFSNYYCTDAPCLPSRTALFTGTYGIRNGVVNHGGAASQLRI